MFSKTEEVIWNIRRCNMFCLSAPIYFVDPRLEEKISVFVTSKNNCEDGGLSRKNKKKLQFRGHFLLYTLKKTTYIKDTKRPLVVRKHSFTTTIPFTD